MRILITNDDGIHSPGLGALERIAATLSDDVWVVAPELDQSGLSHSLSLSDPLRLRRIGPAPLRAPRHAQRLRHHGRAPVARRAAGADPVGHQLRLQRRRRHHLFRHHRRRDGGHAARHPVDRAQPGLRLRSRRARGAVGDGGEACAGHHPQAHGLRLPEGILYNLNFPNRAPGDVGEVVVTAQGKLIHGLHVDERRDGRNLPYFWVTYRRDKSQPYVPGSDDEAVERGLISVTPLRLDMTAHDLTAPLRRHMAGQD